MTNFDIPLIIEIFTGKTIKKRTLTVTCRYEPDELADQRLSDAYDLLLRYAVKRNNEKEVGKSDNNSLVCKSLIKAKRGTTQ